MSWFKPRAKAVAAAQDYSALRTDVHSHLIPGVDDGAQTLDQTVALLQGFKAMGYQRVITTPHIRADIYLNEAQDLRRRHAELLTEPRVQAVGVAIELAAEYYLDEHFLALLERDELLSFAGRHLLIETDHQQRNVGLKSVVERLRAAGYQPVLAHPERYAYGWADPRYFLPLREAGLLLQVNITAFSGHYGKQILRVAEQLADWGVVDLLGSDCHKTEHQGLMRRALQNPHLQQLLQSPVIKNAAL